ncbi:uncharacterized protein K02A2.6-like [Actinia tenebrosa]|uniref:Uncharacterized protein K02A2.6-like n=1 Tax=Actinia tenebrosa TaxID=6105 RepID=A0A6P8HDM4_ACTTE|nr:uncharacterized protein K02A2.6-like [Actinia tenebrosa]
MWGTRVIVPKKLQDRVLQTLHEGHIGVVKMKGLARGHVWWPNIDKDIERVGRQCEGCQELARNPSSAPLHRWEFPAQPWQQVHIDFAGPFQGRMLLVCVDVHTKWPEIVVMKNTTAEGTVEALRSNFARLGLPEQIVSDNEPQFTSAEFRKFTEGNGIRHVTGAPYHQATNGLAERLVQSFKHAVKADKSNRTLEHKIHRFLLVYRTAPHATTGISPAQLLFQRNPRTRLDLLKPSVKNTVDGKNLQDENRPFSVFREGDRVWIRNYRDGPKWVHGTVLEQVGPVLYKGQTQEKVWRRHFEQLRRDQFQLSPRQEPPASTDAVNLRAPSTADPTLDVSQPVDAPRPQQSQAAEGLKTTPSGRVIRTPARFKDFDCSGR